MPTRGNGEGTVRSEQEQLIQRQVAFASGLFQGDVTVRTLLESLAEGVVIIDSLGIILLVNGRAERMFGHPRSEIAGKPLITLIPERFRKAHERHVADFFAEPRTRPMGIGLELVGCRRDGSEFPVEISLSYLETVTGIFGLAFITDITVRKEAERALKDRNAELDAFAHTVAHDMKGSLAVVMGYSKLLDESVRDLSREMIVDSVREIWKTGVKLNQIVDALLLLSSVSREDAPSLPLDMRMVVAEAMKRLQGVIEDRKAEIEIPPEFPTALGYAPWVEEIWFNYISNALQYGGNPPRVRLGGSIGKDGYAEFRVEDNGPGLPPDEQAAVFSYSRRRRKKHEGHGLGLTIVKRIVEKLKGHVSVRSGAGGGSVFTFSLPLAGEPLEKQA
jgi:PAS domain S-box-containing protein